MIDKENYLTIKNYKEPLLSVKKKDGFGYYGAITCSTDNKFIQCHYCGELFGSLAPHIKSKHKSTVYEYREEFQIAKSTALISEDYRQVLKEGFLKRIANMTQKEKDEFIERLKIRAKEWASKRNTKEYKDKESHPITLETKNKRGTCPDQLLEKVLESKKSLGYVPSLHEFVAFCGSQRYKHLLFKTYGSWKNVLKT